MKTSLLATAAVARVFVLQAFASTGRLDASAWQALREENLPRVIDHELPADDRVVPTWPHLTPAGVLPEGDDSRSLERDHV